MSSGAAATVSADDRFVFTADQTKPELAVIDTATNTVKQRIRLPAIAYGTAPTPDGRWLLAALRTAGAVALIDVRTQTFVRTIKTGGIPTEILIRPDGNVAYVSCDTNVAVIDLATMEVTGALKAGAGADGLC